MCLCALLVTVPAALRASPVQVIECLHTYLDGPTPYELVDPNYTVHRHMIQTAPIEATENEYWAQGVFEDNGSIDVTITPFGGEPITLEAGSTRTTILDAKLNSADKYIDEAPSGSLDYGIDGWELDSFALILRKQDRTQIVDHTTVPESINREDWDEWTCNALEERCPVECALIWRVPGGSMPCAGPTFGGGVCTTGRYIGRVISISYEEHDEDHSSFTINAGLNDAWVTAQAPYQGLFVTVYEDLGLVFVAWFTFEAPAQEGETTAQSFQSGLPAVFGAEDQRWVTAVGAYSGGQASLNLELTTGGLFNASAPLPTQDTDYGTLDLEFSDCSNGTVTFDVPSAELTGSFPITRVLEENTALCEALAES